MKAIIFLVVFALILLPIDYSFSQLAETKPTLGIVLTSSSPNFFKDDNGYTIVLGEVENTKNFPITGVKIWAGFYDDISKQPLESAIGTTITNVIPPLGKVPYMIKSPNPNAAITNVSVNLLGFNSAIPKNQDLSIESEISDIGEKIKISGNLTNNAAVTTFGTKIHLVFYDAFQPPRLLHISTIELEEAIGAGSSFNFEFDEKFDIRSVGYKIFAESANYLSNIQNVEITRPDLLTKLVTINDVSVTDADGNKLSKITTDTTINIQSKIWIQYSVDQETYEQPYIYYAQVKQFGKKAFVEFIGTFEGSFNTEGSQLTSVEWKPQKAGTYFIETFVWDPNAVPLASKGPLIIVQIN